MKVPAAIILTLLIATPALAVDIVSGSGAVVKNGAGLTVINGDPCAGRGEAACIDHEGDRRDREPVEDLTPAVVDPPKSCDGECGDYSQFDPVT